MNNTKIKHEATGRLYPRPTTICPECETPLILCWGNKILNPYWRHKVSNNCNVNTSNSESLLHQLAKELLCTKLNLNLILSCERKCKCGKIQIIDVPTNITWKCESYISNEEQKGYLDIAGFDDNDKIVFGIEIYNKHKTENIIARNNIEWVELDANSVLDKLDIDNTPNNLNILDRRKLNCACEEIIKNVSYDNNYQENDKSRNDKWKEEGMRKYDLLSIEEIAKRLGFLNYIEYYHCEGQKYLMMARFGKYKFKHEWNLEKFSVKNDDGEIDWKKLHLMDQFISRQQCMCCETKYNATKYRPYCFGCYENIKNEEDSFEETEIDINLKKELRSKFRWLDKVPDGEKGIYGKYACFFCNKSIDNKYDYAMYFYDKHKRCCANCLDKQCLYHKIFDTGC